MSTHYDVLGLPRTATHEQIVDQYHALAKVVHPDMGGDTVMFQVLQESYDVIGDPVERARYDQLLALGMDDEPAPTAHRAPTRPAASPAPPPNRASFTTGKWIDSLSNGVEQLLKGLAIRLAFVAAIGALVLLVDLIRK